MATNLALQVALRIDDLRITQDRSKRWLSYKTGIPLTTLLRKLDGHTDFTVSDLSKIARALRTTPWALLTAASERAGDAA